MLTCKSATVWVGLYQPTTLNKNVTSSFIVLVSVSQYYGSVQFDWVANDDTNLM